ncbi:MAG: hypothetical protein L6R37_001775 [Teloschistes peruensis]|nr:MAG: hypothetical protein L6R37_001775 [Teloschistes peruensis]
MAKGKGIDSMMTSVVDRQTLRSCGRPPFMYHICRFPPPRSGPVARNWKSAIHSDCATLRHVSGYALSGADLA